MPNFFSYFNLKHKFKQHDLFPSFETELGLMLHFASF